MSGTFLNTADCVDCCDDCLEAELKNCTGRGCNNCVATARAANAESITYKGIRKQGIQSKVYRTKVCEARYTKIGALARPLDV